MGSAQPRDRLAQCRCAAVQGLLLLGRERGLQRHGSAVLPGAKFHAAYEIYAHTLAAEQRGLPDDGLGNDRRRPAPPPTSRATRRWPTTSPAPWCPAAWLPELTYRRPSRGVRRARRRRAHLSRRPLLPRLGHAERVRRAGAGIRRRAYRNSRRYAPAYSNRHILSYITASATEREVRKWHTNGSSTSTAHGSTPSPTTLIDVIDPSTEEPITKIATGVRGGCRPRRRGGEGGLSRLFPDEQARPPRPAAPRARRLQGPLRRRRKGALEGDGRPDAARPRCAGRVRHGASREADPVRSKPTSSSI